MEKGYLYVSANKVRRQTGKVEKQESTSKEKNHLSALFKGKIRYILYIKEKQDMGSLGRKTRCFVVRLYEFSYSGECFLNLVVCAIMSFIKFGFIKISLF